MHISELCEEVYEDLNGKVVDIYWRDALTIFFECDDWVDHDRRRAFKLHCVDTAKHEMLTGHADSIWLNGDHPLLWEYNGPSAGLYFSSKPENPYELIGRITVEHDRVFAGWLPVFKYTNGLTDNLITVLSRSHGLIASGPLPLMESYQESISDLLKTNIVVGRDKHDTYQILILDSCYAICRDVEVEEIETMPGPGPAK